MPTPCLRFFALVLLASSPVLSHAAERPKPLAFRTGVSPEGRTSSGTGVFTGKVVEKISLRDAINMALRNNLDAKSDFLGIRSEHAKMRFEAGAFDPTFSINVSRESLRRPENANDFTSVEQVRQQNQINAANAQAIALNNVAASSAAQSALTNAQFNAAAAQVAAAGGNQQLAAQQQAAATANLNAAAVAFNSAAAVSRSVNNGSGLTTFNSTIFDQQNDRFSANLIERTPWGMRYGFFVEANRLRNTFGGDTRQIFPEYQTLAQVQVVQPLLKDFGPAANLSNLRIARLSKKIAILTWKQRVETSIQSVMSTYYEMLFGLADIGVKQEAIEADNKLVRQNQRRLEVGFMQPFDVQQARAQVSLDEEQLLTSKNQFMERQFALKRLIIDRFNVNDARMFYPLSAPALVPPVLDRSLFLQQAFANRADFQQALAEADAQDIRLRFARNQLLPQLDLVATYGLNGLTQGSSGDSFNQAFEGRTPSWTFGLNFRVPLGNVQARAQLDLVKAQKEQAIIKIKQSELGIGVDVDTVISRIETNQQRLVTARNTSALFEEAVRIAYRRLDEGQISSFDIIEQQRKLYDARSRELAARTELNKSITQLWLVTGMVLEKMNIRLGGDDIP